MTATTRRFPLKGDGLTGRAQFLIWPENATVPNGVNMSGGMDQFDASNFGTVHANRNYFGTYFQDDWAITRKLTLNLGVRWEHFGLTGEAGGAQANFVQPSLTTNAGAELIITAGQKNAPVSSSFTSALQKTALRSSTLTNTERVSVSFRKPTSRHALGSPIHSRRSGWFAAGMESFTAPLKIVEGIQAWAITTRSNSRLA